MDEIDTATPTSQSLSPIPGPAWLLLCLALAPGADPLGGPAEGCPQEVHDRMLALFAKGGVPRSTPAMRLKHRRTAGEGYKIFSSLQEAFDFGYVSPNLNPPLGFIWGRRGEGWQLKPQGG
jgi:hypothetical protein